MPGLLRRIRLRFGISAPKMAVRTQVAWYWRWLAMLVLVSLSLLLAAWMYDAGRRFAGFDQDRLGDEMQRLREQNARLTQEVAKLRSTAAVGESRLKMEQAAGAQLAGQLKALGRENGRLREDLALFENVVSDNRSGAKVDIHRFKVEREVLPGEYRYRLLVIQNGRRDRPFQGSLQVIVDLQHDGQPDRTIILPGPGEARSGAFKLNFRFFRRIEGTFHVPPGARVRAVQVRILQSGSKEAIASEKVTPA